jgi:RND family efflux transporter MFP subunit
MTSSTRSKRSLSALLWLSSGLAAGVVLFLDPGDWHSLDDRLRGGSEASREHALTGEPAAIEQRPMAATAAAAAPEDPILFYRNPMDPTITSPVPLQDSMGMDYIPVRASEARPSAGQPATVSIDPTVVQNMNVRTERAERRVLQQRIRSVGSLEFDQERMVTVTTKYAGWVEKVYANYVGERVRRGAPLFEIYSPELVQTQQELLSALDYTRRLADAPAETRARAEALVDAARTRLGYWDIAQDQVAELEASHQVFRTLSVVSPANGVIMKRQAGLEGMAVSPGLELFHIADLSSLWLLVQLFEEQLSWIHEGTEADFTLSYFPGRTFSGKVRYIEPEVSEKTRTLGVKIEVPNPDGTLRPGMFATIVFRPQAEQATLTVPSLAVIRTGRRDLVIVQESAGRFTPREVTLGNQSEGLVEVLAGLEEGEVVVTSGQFLLDSEASVQEAIQKLISDQAAPAPAMSDESPTTMQHDHH